MAASLFTVQAEGTPFWQTSLIDRSGNGGSLALDSSGTPHVVFSHSSVLIVDALDWSVFRLDYAVWNGDSWDIQTVDPSGSGGRLALDADGNPHIIYRSGNNPHDRFNLSYAVLKDGNWNIQTIDNRNSIRSYVMTLDSTGNPVVLFVKDHNGNIRTQEIDYARYDGENWVTQTIDTVNSPWLYNEVALTLDSNGTPHVLYLQGLEEKSEIFHNVKYAVLSNGTWQIQTALKKAHHIGNLVVNEQGQRSFCCQKNDDGDVTYAFWDGEEWISQPITSSGGNTRRSILHYAADGKPQVYFYMMDDRNSSNNGLIFSELDGSNWRTMNLGHFINDTTYFFSSQAIVDMKFNSEGNPVFIADGFTDSVRSAWQKGGLTYAALSFQQDASSESSQLLIPIAITVAVVGLIIALFRFKIKRTKHPQKN